jgi:hypothetical protein
MVYSSKPGVCPGSIQLPGLFILAMLTASVLELTLPKNSSIILGLLPAACTITGERISFGILVNLYEFNFCTI